MAGKVAFAAQEVSGKRQKEVFARLRRNESRVSRSDSITSLQNRTRTSFWARKPHQRLLRRTPPLKISTDLLTHGIRAETAQKLTPRKRSARPQSAARALPEGRRGPGQAGGTRLPPLRAPGLQTLTSLQSECAQGQPADVWSVKCSAQGIQ